MSELNFPSNPTNGQEYIVGLHTYVWVASSGVWDLKTTVTEGPTGPTGPQGVLGPTGPTGAQGIQGYVSR